MFIQMFTDLGSVSLIRHVHESDDPVKSYCLTRIPDSAASLLSSRPAP